MEEIFNKIIEIDKEAKLIISEEKAKKENIENYIQSEFNTKKVILDLEYKDEIELQRRKLGELFEEEKQRIDRDINEKIAETENYYREKENELVEQIIQSIKNGEE